VQSETLARTLQDFISDSRNAVVIEDGAVTFDLERAKYSISSEHGKCLLHFWSEERNSVRRVTDAELKNGVLRLAVLRFGQTRPSKIDICRERDRRTPSARKVSRAAYQQHLRRVLERNFPGFVLAGLTSAMDLERSFGPVYARGLLRKGRSAFAVLGVNGQELQGSIDASLTFAVLWLDACRESQAAFQVEGVKVFVPPGTAGVVRERMAHLHAQAAKWHLYELQERDESIHRLDVADRGNLATRLVRCIDESAVRARFEESIARIRKICRDVEIGVISTAEVAFRYRGLEFARARLTTEPGTFSNVQEIVFGVGPQEAPLTNQNAPEFVNLLRVLIESRQSQGPRHQTLWRVHPERWLEALVLEDVTAIDGNLDPTQVYSQVPAFAAADRAMVDVLGVTRAGQLAVIELKAEEDIHLPLQGLDYWARVKWHQARNEFQKFGYFPDRQFSEDAPVLMLVAPALHIHPATDILLHYLSPEIRWTLVGIDERWREAVRVVFRKRSAVRSPEYVTAQAGAG
jgi:hypothetical protein